MCKDPDLFMPDNTYYAECGSESDNPAVETDCPASCNRGSYDNNGTAWYYCVCEVTSAADCRAMYPGEEHANALRTLNATQRMLGDPRRAGRYGSSNHMASHNINS